MKPSKGRIVLYNYAEDDRPDGRTRTAPAVVVDFVEQADGGYLLDLAVLTPTHRNVPMLGDGETPGIASMPPGATTITPGVAYWPPRV